MVFCRKEQALGPRRVISEAASARGSSSPAQNHLFKFCGGQRSPSGEGRREETLAYLGVSGELWWGLPPQDSDYVEDAVSCGVVGLVDGERLLGQVFVFVGVFLLRNETSGLDSTCQPPGLTLSHLHTFAGAMSLHRWLLWSPVPPPYHEAVESNSDLLPSQCPPPACLLLGP